MNNIKPSDMDNILNKPIISSQVNSSEINNQLAEFNKDNKGNFDKLVEYLNSSAIPVNSIIRVVNTNSENKKYSETILKFNEFNAKEKYNKIWLYVNDEKMKTTTYDFFLANVYNEPDAKVEYLGEKIAKSQHVVKRGTSPYERTKAEVYARGNKWQIERWEATHN